MNAFSYQHTVGRGNPTADPPTFGFYPQRCARYHRFKITKPGNFTFVSVMLRFLCLCVCACACVCVCVCVCSWVCMSLCALRVLHQRASARHPEPPFFSYRLHDGELIEILPTLPVQDSCASMMSVGMGLFKRTDDLSKSAPRMTPGGRLQPGQTYDVPLFDHNLPYRTIETGLIPIQPDRLGQGLIDFYNAEGRYDPSYPLLTPDSVFVAANGCPMSGGVLRTYFIGEVGEYFLETQGADVSAACNNFEVKMMCTGDAETASPAESNPLGFTVDADTGAITGTPKKVRDGYTMRLRAVDAADVRATVASWTFDVMDPPAFKLNPSAGWSMETDGTLTSKYKVAETHLLPKPRLKKTTLLLHPSGSAYDRVVYLLSAKAVAGNPSCSVEDTDDNRVISALTDVATGAGAMNIRCDGNYTAKLTVRDGGGNEVVLRNWTFEVLRRDTDVPEYVIFVDPWLCNGCSHLLYRSAVRTRSQSQENDPFASFHRAGTGQAARAAQTALPWTATRWTRSSRATAAARYLRAPTARLRPLPPRTTTTPRST